MHLLFSNEQFLVNCGGVLAGCISGSSSAPTRLHYANRLIHTGNNVELNLLKAFGRAL